MKLLQAEVHDEELRNMLKNFPKVFMDKTYEMFNKVGSEIVHDMQESLKSGDHVDSGNLVDSIAQKTTRTNTQVKTSVVITAMSENKKWYAQFIEHGTGIYNDSGNGRTDGWYYIYKGDKLTPYEEQWKANNPDKYEHYGGVKRFTHGQKADPFIEPSVDTALETLGVKLKELVYDTVRESK